MLSVLMVADFSALAYSATSLEDDPTLLEGSPKTIWVDDDFIPDIPSEHKWNTIGEGVIDAEPGDTVFVFKGVYTKAVWIDKTIDLKGEDPNGTIIELEVGVSGADWVRITGFTFSVSPMNLQGTLTLYGSDHCYIANSTFSGNEDSALVLFRSHNNTIFNNSFESNHISGIELAYSHNNIILNNTFVKNFYGGIHIRESIQNRIQNSNMTGGFINGEIYGDGIRIFGSKVEQWNTHTIDTSNTLNGKPILYYKNVTSGTVPSNAGQVILGNCTHMTVENQEIIFAGGGIQLGHTEFTTVKNNVLRYDRDGISLQFSRRNIVTENTASSSSLGVRLFESYDNKLTDNDFLGTFGFHLDLSNHNTILNNTITYGSIRIDHGSSNNTVSYNTIRLSSWTALFVNDNSDSNMIMGNSISSTYSQRYAIRMSKSSGNLVYHNNLIDNPLQAYDTNPVDNDWHHPILLEGNYWSDYTGLDDGSGTGKHSIAGDGIGDTLIPHPESDYDFYPCMVPGCPTGPGSIPPVADAGPDQTVNEGDTAHFNGTGSHSQGGNGGVWALKTDALVPMTSAASTTLNDEIYLIGGDTIDCIVGPTSVVQKYNPSNDSWSRLPDLPAERVHLGAATVNGKIYAIGGSNGNLSTNTTFEYDPATNNWTTKAPMPIWMEGFGMAVANDRIYVVGGWSTFMYCYPCGMVFEYDPSTDSWSTKPDMLTARAYLAAVGLENSIYAIGGDAGESANTVEVYDPITENWTKKANMTTNRAYLSAEALGGNIYAFGGAETSGPPLNSTEMYNPSDDSWTPKSPMIEAKVSPGSGVVGKCVYSAGGYGGLVPFSSNEEYCLDGELTYEWDFDASVDSDGDGIYTNDKEATGPTPTHMYYDDGVYTVTLTVTDTRGLQDADQCNITVLNVPPTPLWTSRSVDGAILNPPYPEGEEILFEATVYDPGIYDTFTFDWDFGDGTLLIDAGPSVIHAYGDNDTYIVVLKVTDDDGGIGIDDTPPLLTTNEDPMAWVSLPRCPFFEGRIGCPISGSFTDPGWLDTHSAVWSFGDGEYEIATITEENEQPDATGMNDTMHAYGDNGVYNITFTVIDDDGGTYTAFAWASPMNLPPSISVDIPSVVNEGEDFDLGITATDPGSDDLTINVDWGDGTFDLQTFYNDGVGPDPPNSGPGVFPFVVQANLTHVYPDDGSFNITVTVEDDDGGSETKSFPIPVLNVAPTVELEVLPIEADVLLRIAGEKWHDVTLELYEDGVLMAEGSLVRYPGSPNDQMLNLTHLSVDISKKYSAIVRYTPEDDPINGQPNGANPCWIILRFNDGDELWLHHTFNVQHEETYVWEVDLMQTILMHGITFRATAYDPGADDLTFTWDFGDGTNTTSFYPNTNGAYPVVITEKVTHAFPGSGLYNVTVTVEDDDGGIGTASFTIHIP